MTQTWWADASLIHAIFEYGEIHPIWSGDLEKAGSLASDKSTLGDVLQTWWDRLRDEDSSDDESVLDRLVWSPWETISRELYTPCYPKRARETRDQSVLWMYQEKSGCSEGGLYGGKSVLEPPGPDFVKVNVDVLVGWGRLDGIGCGSAGQWWSATGCSGRVYERKMEPCNCRILSSLVRVEDGIQVRLQKGDDWRWLPFPDHESQEQGGGIKRIWHYFTRTYQFSSSSNVVEWSHVKKDRDSVAHNSALIIPPECEQVWVGQLVPLLLNHIYR